MKNLWARREIAAPAPVVWAVLTAADRWSAWGPSIRAARVDGDDLGPGATGTVTTVAGVDLDFEITEWEPGRRWAWKVAGVGATDHTVDPLGSDRCRVGFGVPWAAAPYLAVCHVALRRIESLALEDAR